MYLQIIEKIQIPSVEGISEVRRSNLPTKTLSNTQKVTGLDPLSEFALEMDPLSRAALEMVLFSKIMFVMS